MEGTGSLGDGADGDGHVQAICALALRVPVGRHVESNYVKTSSQQWLHPRSHPGRPRGPAVHQQHRSCRRVGSIRPAVHPQPPSLHIDGKAFGSIQQTLSCLRDLGPTGGSETQPERLACGEAGRQPPGGSEVAPQEESCHESIRFQPHVDSVNTDVVVVNICAVS